MATRRMPKSRVNHVVKAAKSKKLKNIKVHASKHLSHKSTRNPNPLRKSIKTAVEVYDANDFEEALISDMLAKAGNKISACSLLIPEALYSSTAAMRNFAYNSGFSVGKNIYAKGGDLNAMLELLGNGELSKMLYYPFDDRSIFIGKPRPSVALGGKVHIYEAGMLAGYLSASTGMAIDVHEKYCVHNGDAFCQFVAVPKGTAYTQSATAGNFSDVVDRLAAAVMHSKAEDRRADEDYYLLYMLPLLEKPIAENLYGIFYAAGGKIAEYAKNSTTANEELLGSMSKTTGAESAKFVKRNGSLRGISIRYGRANSISSLVNAYAALFAGMVKDLYSSGVEIKRELMANNSYMLRMRLKPG
ncbi:MAG: 4-vinyl reductase [Candidatus Micrarchaeaceae archaeon]